MTTAQTAASRINGAQSQGPKTDEGKARSSMNSLKHGLCSKEFVLDDPAELARFEILVQEIIFNHQAVTELQKRLCQRLAVAHWRLDVCDNLEALFWQAVERGEISAESGGLGYPSLSTITRYRARLARDLRETKSEIEDAKRLRVDAMRAQMDKARKLASPDSLQSILGADALASFVQNIMSEPEAIGLKARSGGDSASKVSVAQTNPSAQGQAADHGETTAEIRKKKRRAEKLARRNNRR